MTNPCELLPDTFKEVERWHSQTSSEYRTIDNLVSCLKRNNHFIPFVSGLEEEDRSVKREGKKVAISSLASFLQFKKLDFKLTPLAVDSVLRPREVDFVEPHSAYEFFLMHYHEHPYLEPYIKKSFEGLSRLGIVPVSTDSDLAVFLFNPWEMKTYAFSVNPSKDDNFGFFMKNGNMRSVSQFSILEDYNKEKHFFDNPFSEQYKTRMQRVRDNLNIYTGEKLF